MCFLSTILISLFYATLSPRREERGEGGTHRLYKQTVVQAGLYKCVELIYDDQMHDQNVCPSLIHYAML